MPRAYAQIASYAVYGIRAYKVSVEIDITPFQSESGGFMIVGLPEGAVKESRDRVRAAIGNSGLWFPSGRITANLAPADIRKEGAAFDLPLAIGALVAGASLEGERLANYALVGELGLSGEVRPIRGALPLALGVRDDRMRGLILPAANAAEAAVVEGIDVIPVATLSEAVAFLRGEVEIAPTVADLGDLGERLEDYTLDMGEVRGQTGARRALEVAASGGHNLLMIGPPGSGKTMLARRFPSILPSMSFEESVETTKIHSIAGLVGATGLVTNRPFRSPHHTMSNVSLVGGGAIPRPGEVSLAHHGVLFLDEMPEFPRQVLESLRQPLEDGVITITRAAMTCQFPAQFMLCGSMNPCPCGYMTDPARECRCTPFDIQRYHARLSGPLLDRIDIHMEVPAVKYQELTRGAPGESSRDVRARVRRAREIQQERFKGIKGVSANAHMRRRELEKYCRLDDETLTMLETAMTRMNLSARAYDRILKVARTVADLAGRERIAGEDVSEAIRYRTLDRAMWRKV